MEALKAIKIIGNQKDGRAGEVFMVKNGEKWRNFPISRPDSP